MICILFRIIFDVEVVYTQAKLCWEVLMLPYIDAVFTGCVAMFGKSFT